MSNERNEAGVESFSMPFGEHLEELRGRLLVCIALVAGVFLLAWFFREGILGILVRPHVRATGAFQLDPTLKFATYLEPVTAQLKACLVVALVFSVPVLLYELWTFIVPGLYKGEQRMVTRIGFLSISCFAAGVLFGYFLFIPLALRFLLALSGAQTEPVLMISSYLSLLFVMTLVLGIVFQTPLIMFYLVRWGVVSVEAIQKHRKSAILLGFILAAFFTPPDPFTQVMMAVPLIVLYDIGALLAAPSRQSLANFGKFAGTVGVIVGVVMAFYFLWPVGRIAVVRGTALRGSHRYKAGTTARLHRGQVWRLQEQTAAALRFTGGPRPNLAVCGPTRLQVHGRWVVSLYGGTAFGDNSAGGTALKVRTTAGSATLTDGQAEFAVPDKDTLTVQVVKGQVAVRSGDRTVDILPGRASTFRRGGEPAEVSDIPEKWRHLLEAPQNSGSGGEPQP